jgi:hypothetical protein
MALIRRLGPGDEAAVRAAAALFDDPPREDAARPVTFGWELSVEVAGRRRSADRMP